MINAAALAAEKCEKVAVEGITINSLLNWICDGLDVEAKYTGNKDIFLLAKNAALVIED